MNIIIKMSTVAVASILAFSACTMDFEYFNTNPDAVQEVDVRSYITTMEMDAIIPCSDVGANEFQRACNLMGDAFAGYLSPSQQFNGGNYTCTYDLNATDYNNYPFSVTFTAVMPAWLKLRYAYENGQLAEEIFAVAEVIKVMCLQRATDIYGPIPVSHFGEDVNPYDSQEQVYMDLFEDLDNAIDILDNYTSVTSDDLAKVDAVYEGDLGKWFKLANSQKLRMAMRIRYVDSIQSNAKEWAEEAVAAGVMTASSDGAWLETSGSIAVQNPLEVVWNMYGDTRMGATMDCYLNGYNDPRLSVYFQEATIDGGGYHGIRSGIASMMPDDDPNYTCLSSPNVQASTPVVWFLASEVAFLRAEGALIGWSMGGDAGSLYENGIELSFEENGLSATAAAAYYTDNDSQPIAFEDCSLSATKYSYGQPSEITPSWDESASEEEKLERIITQKWIAMYPNGQEAWSEFRRTGYPKVIPVFDNRSGGTVDTDEQVRRMTFPRSEYSNNLAQVQAATALLDGGSDTGGTKLWWDKKNN